MDKSAGCVHNRSMPILTYDQIANLSILRQFYYLAWRLVGVNIALISPDRKHSLAFGITEGWSPFCVKMRQVGGEKHCVECDHIHEALVGAQRRSLRYHCWAGLREFIVPIMLHGEILAFIQCGQALDAAPGEQEWLATASSLEDHGIVSQPLRDLFFDLHVIPAQTQQDLMDLLELFGNYIAYAQYQILLSEASQQSRVEERAFSYIRNHFTEPVSLDDVAKAACTSKRNLSRIFQEKTGMTVLGVIQEMRIEEACRQLQLAEKTCAKVAFDCGFGSVQQFNRVFQKLKDCTPQTWRRRFLESNQA
jgi:AraC-like DNA-binding protein